MAVRIVTDSTADMSPHLARELGVSVVPLSVIFGDEVFKEGVQIGHDLFYDKLVRSKVLPTTSAPSVGDFLEVYEPLLAETDEIVSIHLSSKLSATYNNALQAAQQLAERGARIEVVDSQLVSLGMSFVVAAAARAAIGGAGGSGGRGRSSATCYVSSRSSTFAMGRCTRASACGQRHRPWNASSRS